MPSLEERNENRPKVFLINGEGEGWWLDDEESGDPDHPQPPPNNGKDSRDFEFHADQVRTISQLTKGFEARTNLYDRLLLYFLTSKENDSCMQSWQDD